MHLVTLLLKKDITEFRRGWGLGKSSFAVAGVLIIAGILSAYSVPSLCNLCTHMHAPYKLRD